MKAFAYCYDEKVDGQSIVAIDLPPLSPEPADLLVEIDAVSINPVDLKVRDGRPAGDTTPLIAGWDAAGRVIATGSEVDGFTAGDRVMYAGDVTRPGCYASHNLVDHRLAARVPDGMDSATAASIPLTAITAWEALHDHFRVDDGADDRRRLLIINGAGGVGSFAIQLARQAGLHVVATASRPESIEWCRNMGADEVISHDEVAALGENSCDLILCCHDTDSYFDTMTRLAAPFGHICLLSGTTSKQDIEPLKAKSAAVHWEFMFTRSMFQTPDMKIQGEIISRVAGQVADGRLRSTLQKTLAPLSPETLEEGQRLLAKGGMIGKLVITSG